MGKKELGWGKDGLMKYDIVHVNDTYITAYERTNDVGGEVWVMNRITGEYKSGRVGIFYSRRLQLESDDKGSFKAYTYEGRCTKPQF